MKMRKGYVLNTFGMAASLVIFLYTFAIFFTGVQRKILPSFMVISSRNILFVVVTYIIAAAGACLYYSGFLSRIKNDGKIITLAVIGMAAYIISLFFVNDLEVIVFFTTLNGVLMSIFLWMLSFVRYDITNRHTSKTPLCVQVMRILSFVSLLTFLSAVATYYGYTRSFIGYMFKFSMSSYQNDALAFFLFMLGAFIETVIFCLIYFIEYIMIKSRSRHRRDD